MLATLCRVKGIGLLLQLELHSFIQVKKGVHVLVEHLRRRPQPRALHRSHHQSYKDCSYQVELDSAASWVKGVLEDQVDVNTHAAAQANSDDLEYLEVDDIGNDQGFGSIHQ